MGVVGEGLGCRVGLWAFSLFCHIVRWDFRGQKIVVTGANGGGAEVSPGWRARRGAGGVDSEASWKSARGMGSGTAEIFGRRSGGYPPGKVTGPRRRQAD